MNWIVCSQKKYKDITVNNDQVTLKAISVSVEQVNALDALLNDYLAKIPARSILLIDTAGQIVTSCGNLQNADLVTFGTLSAGYLAASQEIARISGEYQEFQMVIREGSRINNFLTDAGAHLALTFNIEVSVPLGWARLNILQAARAVNADHGKARTGQQNTRLKDITKSTMKNRSILSWIKFGINPERMSL